MRRHDFGYFFHEGISNMFSHGFMSFAAIGITVACLLIMGTFTLVAVNADSQPYTAHFDAGCGLAWDLISGQQHDFGGGSQLPPYSAFFWKMER